MTQLLFQPTSSSSDPRHWQVSVSHVFLVCRDYSLCCSQKKKWWSPRIWHCSAHFCAKQPHHLFSLAGALSVTWHGTRLTFAIVHQLVWWMDGVVLFAGAATPFYTRTLTSRCCDGDKYRAIWFRRLYCGEYGQKKQDKMRFNRIPHKLVPSCAQQQQQQGVSRMTDRSYSSGLSQSTQSRLEFSIFIRTHNHVDDIQGQRLI